MVSRESTPAPAGGSEPTRTPLTHVVHRSADLARGTLPLWPINRFFASYAGTNGKVERMLRDGGVEPGGWAGADEALGATQLVRLLKRTMRMTHDELWGQRPVRTPIGTFAQACRHAVAAATVEQALRAAFRAYHGVVDDFTLRLHRDGDHARLTLIDRLPHRPGRDIFHIVVLQALRETIGWLSGRTGFVERVEFRYEPLPHLDMLESIFGAKFVHGQATTGLVIASSLLQRAIVAEEAEVRAFVASLPGKLARAGEDRRSVADRAASCIRARGDWDIGRDAVAEALNMSAATFNRRLQQTIGVGFQDLKDRLRCAAAVELLTAGDLSLEQVARLLGFAELSSFHRAFKRWTGQAPGSFRGCRVEPSKMATH